MRPFLAKIRIARSWGYLARSWREAAPHFVLLIDFGENATTMFKACLFH